MGNLNFVDIAKDTQQISNNQVNFNLEDMMREDILWEMFKKFRSENARSGEIEEKPSQINFFNENNLAEENNYSDKAKNGIIEELNELYTSGLCKPQYIKAKLREPKFEKFFVTRASDWNGESNRCFYRQYFKLFLLYSYIGPYYASQENEKNDFLKKLAEYCEEKSTEKIESYSLIMGMIFSFTMISEIRHSKPEVVKRSLSHMYSTLLTLKEGCLEEHCMDFSNRLEETFNEQRSFLVSLIEDERTTKEIRVLATKILVLFGKVRASGEDLLIAVNLINQHKLGIDISNELNFKVNKSEGAASDNNAKDSFRLDTENQQMEVKLLTGIDDSPSYTDTVRYAMDESYIYMTVSGKGVYKIGYTKSVKVKPGLTYAKNMFRDFKAKVISVAGDRVYLRQSEDQETPLIILNKQTLEEDKEDKVLKSLNNNKRNYDEDDWNKLKFEVTNKDKLRDIINKSIRGSFRCLTKTPLFYDGESLCVISTYFVKGETDQEFAQFQTMEKYFSLEMYDPETMTCTETKKLDLEKENIEGEQPTQAQIEELEDFKEHLYDERFQSVTLAHNRKNIVIIYDNYMYIFDFESGKRITERIELPFQPLAFNIKTSQFWYVDPDTSDFTFKTLSISDFDMKKDELRVQNLGSLLQKRVISLNSEIQKNSVKIPKRSAMNLLKGLTKSTTSYSNGQKVLDNSQEIKSDQSSFLVTSKLFYCARECENLINDLESIDKNNHEEILQLETKLFRQPFGITIGREYFNQLSTSLAYFFANLGKGNNPGDILMYHQFYSVFKLLSLALKISRILDIPMETILQDSDENDVFFRNLNDIVTMVSEIYSNIPSPSQDGFNEELYSLWKEVQIISQEIQFLLLNLTSGTSKITMESKIKDLINAFEEGNVDFTNVLFMKYLSQPLTMEIVICDSKEETTLPLMLQLFEILVKKKTTKTINHLEKLGWDTERASFDYDEIEEVSEEFIYETSKRILVYIFSRYKRLYDAHEEDNKKRVETVKKEIDDKMVYYDQIVEILSSSAIKIFDSTTEKSKAIVQTLEENLIHTELFLQENKDKNKKVAEIYYKHTNHLNEIIVENNKFLDLLCIYSLALGSEYEVEINPHNIKLIQNLLKVLSSYTKYAHLSKKSMIFKKDDHHVIKSLDLGVMRDITWSLAKYAGGLGIPQSDKPDSNIRELMRSRLFSGGIEDRFITSFNDKTKSELKILQEYKGDKLDFDANSRFDSHLYSIVHEGRDESLDLFIDFLAWYDTRNDKEPQELSAEEKIIIRCLFSSILKLNDLVDTFKKLLQSFCVIAGTSPSSQKFPELANQFESTPDFTILAKKWNSSTKIKSWYSKWEETTKDQKKKKEMEKLKQEEINKEKSKKESEDSKEDSKESPKEENKESPKPDEASKEEQKKEPTEKEDEKKEDKEEEEKIDTTKKEDKPSVDQEKIDKAVEEAKALLIRDTRERAELFLILNSPEEWSKETQEWQQSILAKREHEFDTKKNKDKKNNKKGFAGLLEKVTKKDSIDTCQGALLDYYSQTGIDKEIHRQLEHSWLNGYKRYVGLDILGELLNCKLEEYELMNTVMWFMKSIKGNYVRITDYVCLVKGCGHTITNLIKESFFKCIRGISYQLTTGKEISEGILELLFEALIWKYDPRDHKSLAESGIIEALTEGNGVTEGEFKSIKYKWGHNIFKKDNLGVTPAFYMISILESIVSSVFSQANSSKDKDECKKDELLKVGLMRSPNEDTQILIQKLFMVFFNQFDRYVKLIDKFNPIDWRIFVQERNKQRASGQSAALDMETQQLPDELTPEEEKHNREEEEKKDVERENRRIEEAKDENANPRDFISEITQDETEKEMKKIGKIYDYHTLTKMLRMLDMFASIASVNEVLKHYLIKILNETCIDVLLNLFLVSQHSHGLIILNIFKNLLNVQFDIKLFDKVIANSQNEQIKKILGLKTKFDLSSSTFLRFLYNQLLSIRAHQWSNDQLASSGSYDLSCGILRLLHTISKDKSKRGFAKLFEKSLDNFLDSSDSYSIEEFDVITSLIEGGEYQGLNIGAMCKSKQKEIFVIIGFVQEWYNLKSDNSNDDYNNNDKFFKINSNLQDKDYILGLTREKDDYSRSTLALYNPQEVTVLSNFKKSQSSYLLNKAKLDKFIKAMNIDVSPDTSDSLSLTKRCIGMKILVHMIERYGDKLNTLFELEFKNKLVGILMKESTNNKEAGEKIPAEWLEQKLYSIKSLATESSSSLISKKEAIIRFSQQVMSLSKPLKTSEKEIYARSVALKAGMNYGKVEPSMKYKVLPYENIESSCFSDENVVICDSSQCDTTEKLLKIFEKCSIIVTCDVDIRKLHKELKAIDRKISYFKSIVLIDKSEVTNFLEIISNDPDFGCPSTDEMSMNETFIAEISNFLGIDRAEVREAIKGNEGDPLSKKVTALTKKLEEKYSKNKNDKEEEEKKEKVENDDGDEWFNLKNIEFEQDNNSTQGYGLNTDPKFSEIVDTLAAYDSGNYSLEADGEKNTQYNIYEKVYKKLNSDVESEYLKTLSFYYKQLCRKCISAFFQELNMKEVLKLVQETSGSLDKFMSYILIKGNEAAMTMHNTKETKQLEEFEALISKLIKTCNENEEFTDLFQIFYKKSIIRHNIDILTSAIKSKSDNVESLYGNETVGAKTLNVLIIPNILSIMMKTNKDYLYSNESQLDDLISMLFLITLTFRTEFKLQKSIYLTIYKLLLPIAKDPDNYSYEIKVSLLKIRVFQRMIDKCKFDVTVSSGNRLTVEQKLLFEIFSVFHKIDSSMRESWSLYTYTDTLLELEKSKFILREGKGFDMISYLMYFNNELSGPQQHTKAYAETFHNQFKTKISSKIAFEGFKKMTFRFDEISDIDSKNFIGISSDPAGESILKKFSYEDMKGGKSVDIYSNQCYIHYPYSPPRILATGENYNYELGQDNSSSYDKTVEMMNYTEKVKKVMNSGNYTVVLTENNQLYYCGYKSSFERTNQTLIKYHKVIPKGEIKHIDCGGTTMIMAMDDGKIYFEGYDTGYHYSSCYGEEKYTLKYKQRPNEEEEEIIDLNVGKDYHMYITADGKLYALGNTIFESLNIPRTDDGKYKQIELDEGVIPKKVICSESEYSEKTVFLLVEVEGKTELWSAGKSNYGLLGQGDGISVSEKFKPVEYDKENVTIKDFEMKYDHAVAITTDGTLLGWGRNDDKQLGFSENKNFYTPTKIPYFEDYTVHEISCGMYHSVVKASIKSEKDKVKFFNLGNNNGFKNDNKTDDGILYLEEFDNVEPKFWTCGKRTTYWIFDGEESGAEGVGIHEGYTCDYTKQTPIVGTMHFYQDSNKEWHFLSKEGYEASKEDLPDITYATKYHIEDIQGKEWPEFDSTDTLEESKDKHDCQYIASLKINGEQVAPAPKYTEKEMFEKEVHDMNPIIFYRLARPLKEDKSLPMLELEKYHEKTEFYGIRVEADPDYSFMKNEFIMALEIDKYTAIQSRIQNFDSNYDEELMKQIENNLEMQQQNFIECPYVFLMAAELEFEDPNLRALPTENIQSRIDSLVMFNQYLLKSLPFLYFNEGLIHRENCGETELETESLTACFIEGKKYALESIKKSYLKTISDTLEKDYSTPSIEVNTSQIKKWYDEGVCDTMGKNTMFGKMFKKLKEKHFENLRIEASTNYGWYANFTNEGNSNDGTYRKCQSWMIDEIHSSFLPLFIPSKNNKEKSGPFQDRWVINPSCTSSLHLEMYRFVGALIAKAFRSGHVMNFRFPSLFWKKFACEPMTLEDIENVDQNLAQTLKNLKKEDPDNNIQHKLSFTVELSDGTVVPLLENGEEAYVNPSNAQEYINLVLNKRFSESQLQMDALKQGFDVVFPSEASRILSWQDIESRVRGDECTVEILKKITDYSDMNQDDEWGTKFWNIIESFTPEEKSRYLRCVGGRTRIPPPARRNELKHKVYLRDEHYFSNHDENDVTIYPESFNIYLNRFSSEEIMKEKILKAIENSEKYYIYGKGDKDSEKADDDSDRESQIIDERSLSQYSVEDGSDSDESEGEEDEEDGESGSDDEDDDASFDLFR